MGNNLIYKWFYNYHKGKIVYICFEHSEPLALGMLRAVKKASLVFIKGLAEGYYPKCIIQSNENLQKKVDELSDINSTISGLSLVINYETHREHAFETYGRDAINKKITYFRIKKTNGEPVFVNWEIEVE